MSTRNIRDLTRAEESFAAQVKYQLRHLPSGRQLALMQTVRRALLQGEPVEGYARLEKELGTPARYADRLLGRGREPEEVTPAPRPKRSGRFGRRR